MRSELDCYPCILNQAVRSLKIAGIEGEEAQGVLAELAREVSALDPSLTPAENSTIIVRRLMALTASPDPYRAAKARSNEMALALLPGVQERIAGSSDPLFAALQAAVAGNVIDMGIMSQIDVPKALNQAFLAGFARSHYAELRRRVEAAGQRGGTVLILGDNSGEIAFDRLLAQELKALGVRVQYAVKGAPIINDATHDDARQVGMGDVAQVFDNGSGYLGTVLHDCSPEFLAAFDAADLIISKGQANFETLEGERRAGDRTFFALKAKCGVIAGHLAVNVGDTVLVQNRPRPVSTRAREADA